MGKINNAYAYIVRHKLIIYKNLIWISKHAILMCDLLSIRLDMIHRLLYNGTQYKHDGVQTNNNMPSIIL